MGSRWVIFIISTVFIFSGDFLRAENGTFQFLQSLENSPYNFLFVREGLPTIQTIHAADMEQTKNYGTFDRMTNQLLLDRENFDDTGNLKDWKSLSENEFLTIIHETYHAYLHNIVNSSSDFEAEKKWLETRANELYPYLTKSRRADALEEAYALYIEQVVRAHLRTIDVLTTDITDVRILSRKQRMAEGSWASRDEVEISSYSFRVSFGQRVGNLFRFLVSSETPAQSTTVNDGTKLEAKDQFWIQQEIFKGQFLRPFNQLFAKELARMKNTPLAKMDRVR